MWMKRYGLQNYILNKLDHRLAEKNQMHYILQFKDYLQTAIENQGTTIINFYFGEGKEGNFREQFQVFGRQDKNCPRCDSN